MIRALILALAVMPGAAFADILVATRTIRPQSLIGPADLAVQPGDAPGLISDPVDVIGLETRVTIYAGRPIRAGDLGPPALVERNQIVSLIYNAGGLLITTDARALDRAGVGERIRVMNLSSRTTVFGAVTETGTVNVSGGRP